MQHAKARLEWADARKYWAVEDFQRVIKSDECSVEQPPTGQQRWIFCMPGKERWNVDCVNPVKHRRVKLMVWGCFWGKPPGPLVLLKTGSVNARVYLDRLRRWLLPVPKNVQAALGNPLFQQGNVNIHTTKLRLSFFKRYPVPHESHSACSPDLNLFAHVLTLLKRHLRVDYPELIN